MNDMSESPDLAILDENLAGLNLEIDLPIKKSCLNKFAKI